MTTFKERLEAGLKAYGWTSDPCDRSKYDAFKHPEKVHKLFVGPSGALRKGECASRSYSIGSPGMESPVYLKILAKGDMALGLAKAELLSDESLLAIIRARQNAALAAA